MIIQNREHTYVVVQKLESEKIEQYGCRDVKREPAGNCRAASVPSEHAGRLIPYLDAQTKKKEFTDFLEYFTDPGHIYVITAASLFPTLEEKMAGERCLLAERVEIAKNMLTKLLLLGADDFFCCAALSADRVCVSPALEVGFQYDLEEILEAESFRFERTGERLALVLSFLFQEELGLKAFPEMEEFIGKLKTGSFSGLMEAYRFFLPIYEAWAGKKETDLKPESPGFKLWEFLKKCGRLAVGFVKLGILLLALLYLILTVREALREPDAREQFSEIGTVELKEPRAEGK